MGDPAGEAHNGALRLDFDRRLDIQGFECRRDHHKRAFHQPEHPTAGENDNREHPRAPSAESRVHGVKGLDSRRGPTHLGSTLPLDRTQLILMCMHGTNSYRK
jgi:hypothetical protein